MISDYSTNGCKNLSSSSLNNYTGIYPNALNDNNAGAVTIYNKGAYVAFVSWGYYLNGKYYDLVSPYLPVLRSYKVILPAGATGIRILPFLTLDFTDFQTICRKNYPAPVTKCFYLWGSLLYYGCAEMPCPPSM